MQNVWHFSADQSCMFCVHYGRNYLEIKLYIKKNYLKRSKKNPSFWQIRAVLLKFELTLGSKLEAVEFKSLLFLVELHLKPIFKERENIFSCEIWVVFTFYINLRLKNRTDCFLLVRSSQISRYPVYVLIRNNTSLRANHDSELTSSVVYLMSILGRGVTKTFLMIIFLFRSSVVGWIYVSHAPTLLWPNTSDIREFVDEVSVWQTSVDIS